MVMATKSSCCTNSRSSRKETEEGRKEKSLESTKSIFNLQGCDNYTGAGVSLCKGKTRDRMSYIAGVLCHHQVAQVL
jgi:hypothetical protein